MTKKQEKTLKLTLIRSTNGRIHRQKECIRSLGLRRMHHTVEVKATPSVLGMINKVSFLLNVEEV